ncbi:MAG: hypothetical protein KatS3mg039_1609 [Candidatus Kapaibacterium sp.]|nr:MAG: hypothetical protein KatS3mg039_1609 [Candidatus Kapabacteria bacterium]
MLHRIVELQDHLLRAIRAIALLILAPDDGELVQDVGHGVAETSKTNGWKLSTFMLTRALSPN